MQPFVGWWFCERMDIWLPSFMGLVFQKIQKRDLNSFKKLKQKFLMYVIIGSTSMQKFKCKFIVFEA
jgi:hypothetical protein